MNKIIQPQNLVVYTTTLNHLNKSCMIMSLDTSFVVGRAGYARLEESLDDDSKP